MVLPGHLDLSHRPSGYECHHQQNLKTMRGAKSNALFLRGAYRNAICPCVALVPNSSNIVLYEGANGRAQPFQGCSHPKLSVDSARHSSQNQPDFALFIGAEMEPSKVTQICLPRFASNRHGFELPSRSLRALVRFMINAKSHAFPRGTPYS